MIKTFLMISLIAGVVQAGPLPDNFHERSLFCQSYKAFDADSPGQAIDKFAISAEINGKRYLKLGNSKEDAQCEQTKDQLTCTGIAYQVDLDETLEDTTEADAFEANITLNLNDRNGSVLYGSAYGPFGWFEVPFSRKINCEF